MFAEAGSSIDKKFISLRDTLDTKLVPTWRIWWKLWSMRLGALAAAAITYLTAAPNTMNEIMSSLPPWLQSSVPAWIGPLTLGLLFFSRFWAQGHALVHPAVERTPPIPDSPGNADVPAPVAVQVIHGSE